MICEICLSKVKKVSATAYGIACRNCLPGLPEREERLYAELLGEGALSIPPFLDIHSFERFVLKFSLHYLASLCPDHVKRLLKSNPRMLVPRVMANWLKDKILKRIPLMYVSMMEAEEKDKELYAGVYQFKRPVPYQIILDAIEKLSLEIPDEGESVEGGSV
jgi:hypothetical protein